MEGPLFTLDEELSSMLVSAHKQIGILEGMVKFIPDCDIIRNLMILRECHYSRQIDYAGDNFSETIKTINSGKSEAGDIMNIISGYMFSLESSRTTPSDICTIALHGHDSSNRVMVREKVISLGRSFTNLKEYNPTAPDKIRPALADISAFLHNDEKTDVLAKAAIAHYQFEMIHPFECYNGIVGRILLSSILYKHGVEVAPFIGLSEYLYYNKNDYFEILRTTQYSGGYIALIKFFVKSILVAAKRAVEQVENLALIIAEDEKKIYADKPVKSTLMAYDFFKRKVISEIRPISDALGVSFNTAAKAVGILVAAGILTKDSQQSRHRVFVYERFLNEIS
jgi:Fic family protein